MILNLAHYSFFRVRNPVEAKGALQKNLLGTSTVGTVLIANEGVNLNLAGPGEQLEIRVRDWLESVGCRDFKFKTAYSDFHPFKRLKIKIKPEIITLGMHELDVAHWRAPHISTADFRKMLENEGPPPEDTLILDTRNDFEVGVGTFKGATPAGMTSFRDFPKVAERLAKNKKIVMFCTGGIRCEKASAYLRREGFQNVQQLDGGILKYFAEQGTQGFQGACFVFDERTSLE